MTHPRDIFRDKYAGQIGLWPETFTGSPEAIADFVGDILALVVVNMKTDQIRAVLNPILPTDDEETWTRVLQACDDLRDDGDNRLLFQYSQDTDEGICCITRGDRQRGIAFE